MWGFRILGEWADRTSTTRCSLFVKTSDKLSFPLFLDEQTGFKNEIRSFGPCVHWRKTKLSPRGQGPLLFKLSPLSSSKAQQTKTETTRLYMRGKKIKSSRRARSFSMLRRNQQAGSSSAFLLLKSCHNQNTRRWSNKIFSMTSFGQLVRQMQKETSLCPLPKAFFKLAGFNFGQNAVECRNIKHFFASRVRASPTLLIFYSKICFLGLFFLLRFTLCFWPTKLAGKCDIKTYHNFFKHSKNVDCVEKMPLMYLTLITVFCRFN